MHNLLNFALHVFDFEYGRQVEGRCAEKTFQKKEHVCLRNLAVRVE